MALAGSTPGVGTGVGAGTGAGARAGTTPFRAFILSCVALICAFRASIRDCWEEEGVAENCGADPSKSSFNLARVLGPTLPFPGSSAFLITPYFSWNARTAFTVRDP